MAKRNERPQQVDLLEVMRAKNWGQKDLALYLGVSGHCVNRWINFWSIPLEFSPEVEVRLRELTGKTSEELFPLSIRGVEDPLADADLDDTQASLAGVPAERFVQKGLIRQPEQLDEMIFRNELCEMIFEAMKTLTDREREIIRLRFGFVDDRVLTYDEVGAEFNVTRARIRQIEMKALRKLRHPSLSRRLRAALHLPKN